MDPIDVKRDPSVDELMKLVGDQQRQIDSLRASQVEQKAATSNAPEFYQCNACGVHLDEGTRCKQHPNEQVNGVGTVFNPVANTVKLGMISRS